MHASLEKNFGWRAIFLITGIFFLSLNLRPAVTSLAPLAERMTESGLGRGLIGNLTTLPLLLFSIVGFFAGSLGNRFGSARILAVGLLLLASGCLIRSAGGSAGSIFLILGTFGIGAGIALGNVLLPSFVKEHFPTHLGLITAIYVTGMNIGAALGLALAIPIADAIPQDWRGALASWSLPAIVVLVAWLPLTLRNKDLKHRSPSRTLGIAPLLRSPTAWHVTGFMGLQSAIFYSSVAWLPTLLQFRGMTEENASFWVTAMQISGCGASLIIPVLATRSPGGNQGAWVILCLTFTILGLVGTLILEVDAIGIAAILLGLGLNGGFSLAMLFVTLRAGSAKTAANLSSMAQAGGYLFAAPWPVVVAYLSLNSGGWNLAYGVIIALAVCCLFFGLLAARDNSV